MTGTEISMETLAERIADRGRDALVERLRTAYGDAAAAHADLISLDDERIEAMVQGAADRADGLQWRRALAGIAADELGIAVSEALSHPAVARAQGIVGAPSYEQSLAELIAQPVPPAIVPPPAGAQATPPAALAADDGDGQGGDADAPAAFAPRSVSAVDSELPATIEHQAVEPADGWSAAEAPAPAAATADGDDGGSAEGAADELETVEADDVLLELLPEPDPVEYETEAYDVEATYAEDDAPAAFEPEPLAAAVSDTGAVVATDADEDDEDAAFVADASATAPASTELVAANDAAASAGTEAAGEEALQFPAIHLGGVANLPTKRAGLGVRLSADGLDILQGEHDIIGRLIWDEIEALEVPNLRALRRRQQLRARLVVRTPHGDASFEVPDISADDLRERVEPFMRLYGGS